MFIHWTQGQVQQAGRSRISLKAIGKIPIPDFNTLSKESIQKAVDYFNDLQSQPLDEFVEVHCDKTRIAIDNAILDIMGIPQAQPILERMREIWSQEPTLRGTYRN